MRAFISSISGPVLRSDESELLARIDPFGVILMGRSCQSREQVKALVQDIWEVLGRQALIFIDQEGGRVARLKPPVWPSFPAAGRYGELYAADPDRAIAACRLGHKLLAAELADLGIHANCAPDVDVRQPGAHDVIGDRSFGYSAEHVGRLACAAVQGLADGHVAAVIKHIPGHGRALVDSHESLPRVDAPLSDLASDFEAFMPVRTTPMGMTCHLCFEAVDPANPATHSRTVIHEVIRTRIGFDGLLMTDDLGMNALGGTLASRAERAMAAGCDVVMHCSGFVKEPERILSEMDEVGSVLPRLTGPSLERAERAIASVPMSPPEFDRQLAWSDFSALMAPGKAGA